MKFNLIQIQIQIHKVHLDCITLVGQCTVESRDRVPSSTKIQLTNPTRSGSLAGDCNLLATQILFVNGPRGARNPGLGAHVLDLGLETQTTNIWGLVAFRRVVLVHTGVPVDIGVSRSPFACLLGRLCGKESSDCSPGPTPMFLVHLLVVHWGK